MTRLLLSLVALSSLASAVFLGLLLYQQQAAAVASSNERDTAERWAKQQVWATGFYLRDKLNAEQALRLERERCGAW